MSHAGFHELIDSLTRSKTVEDIHDACSDLCDLFGFDRFQYGARLPTSFVKPYYIFISSYQDEWRNRYMDQGYMSIDPSVGYCASHLTPFVWDKIELHAKENDAVRRFMSEAHDFGLSSGVSFPVHSAQGEFAMFSLSVSENPARAKMTIREALPFVHLFTSHLHETVRAIFEREVLPLKRVQLTRREQECLLWTAEGKTTWETSQILGVSERTITFHLQNASTKLNVVNRQHAVARAVSLGLIVPALD